MKAIILAGGLGTRLSEETSLRPKPMVEVGGRPILWHIMKTYSHYGINDFIVCLGYKGYLIKEYFSNYYLHASDVTIDILNNKMEMQFFFSLQISIGFTEVEIPFSMTGRSKGTDRNLSRKPSMAI